MSRAFVAVLLVLLTTPAAVLIYAAFKARSENLDLEEGPIKEPLLIEGVREEQQPPAAAATATAATATAAEEYRKRGPAIGEDHTILEAAKTADFWILFISFLCGVGTGLAVMNNLGQMGLAMGYTDVSIFVSMTSIWGLFVAMGYTGSRNPKHAEKNRTTLRCHFCFG